VDALPVWAGAKAAAPAMREAKMAVFMVVNKLALYSRDREMRVVILYALKLRRTLSLL